MKTNVSCFLLLAMFFLAACFFPVKHASAATWQQASASCQAVMSWALSPGHNFYQKPTDCFYRSSPWPEYSMHSNVGQVMDCADYGPPASLGTCLVTGSGPPNCVKGSMAPPAHSWVDGTDCDSQGCMLGLILGGVASGQTFENGQFCPYDPNANPVPPDQPPASASTSLPPPSVPECNADGSCKVCVGTTCVTTGGTTDPGPPPASESSAGDPGNHGSDSQTNYNFGFGYPGSGSTAGAPAGGSTSSGTGTGTGGPATSADTKCTTGVCDVGEADGAMGGLYQHGSDTVAGVFGGYMNSMKAAPIIGAAGAFFQVSAGGSCPSWHIPGNQYWGQAGFDFSFFCSSAMLALFQLAGFLVLAAGAFCAFRIALY